jgi:uncharacterized protein involved in exopolysaccharide biosynthesis
MAIEEDVKGPRDYLDAMKRRRWRLIIPAFLVVIIAAVVAVSIPAVYESTATVLIEEPEVPREFIQSTITSFAAQRLQVIQQRVMTTQNLVSIINKFDLFKDERRQKPISEIASDFRENISMDLVSAEVIDPSSGRSMQATIAFNISYQDSSRRVAQQVANELVSLYLNENLRDRREKAAETTGFLAEEARRLGQLVGEVENKIADFKRQNAGQLPEQLELNLGLIRRAEADLSDTTRRIQLLEERKVALQSELSQLSPHGARTIDGETVLSPPERLKALQTKLISMQGVYGRSHPDVVKMRREITALQKETGQGTDVNALKTKLQLATESLAATRKKYGAKHPDVVNLQKQIASLKVAIRDAGSSASNGSLAPKPDNPAYIMAQTQLKTIDSQVRSLVRQQAEIRKSLKAQEARVLKIPEAEREFLTLKRDYDNAYIKYKEVKAKQLQAQLAQSLETERKSERFSLIEPPQLPLKPVRPNRIAILFIGLVFAGAAGVGNVFLGEAMDDTVYGPRQLASIVGHQPMVVVPLIKQKTAKTGRRWLIAAVVLIILAAIAAGLYAFHVYVRPLDVMWFSTLRQFGFG